jgi:hypothetical protein
MSGEAPMSCLRTPEHRRRLSVSFPILAACLALPAIASAEPIGREHVAYRSDDEAAEMGVQPVSVVTAADVSGSPGQAIPLTVAVSAKAGRSVASTYLLGLPKGARLSDPDHAVTAADEKAVIDVTNWDLPQLSVTLPPTQAGTYTLAVVAVSRPDNGEPMNFTRSTFVLDATAETRESTTALIRKPPEDAGARDAGRQSAAAPPPASTAPSAGEKAAPVSPIKPKAAAPAAEVFIPEAPANLRSEPQPPVAAPATAKPPRAEIGPTAALALPSAAAKGHAPAPTATPPAAAPIAAPPASMSVSPAPAAPAVIPPARTADANGQMLIERAERLIRIGDISGARLVLERAADRGEPRAIFLLAQTWDPRMLRAWNVLGLRPDPERARSLYAKAAQEGLREAKPLADAMR